MTGNMYSTAAASDGGEGPAIARVLSAAQCRVVARTQRRLAALDGFVHLWVRDARSFAHGRESDVPPFALRVHPTLPVEEVRDMVQNQLEALSTYRWSHDGALQLFYQGRVLQRGKLLAEYTGGAHSHVRGDSDGDGGSDAAAATGRQRRDCAWPAPFAGILWIVPFRDVGPSTQRWGSYSAMKPFTPPSPAPAPPAAPCNKLA